MERHPRVFDPTELYAPEIKQSPLVPTSKQRFIDTLNAVIRKAADLSVRSTLAASLLTNPASPRPLGSAFDYSGTRIVDVQGEIIGAGVSQAEFKTVIERDKKDIGQYGMFYYGHRAFLSDSSGITDWYRAAKRRVHNDQKNHFVEELYTKEDDSLISEDISQMEFANQDFAISSWDHRGDARDQFLQRLKKLYKQPGWEHEDFKWLIIYEREGYGNPTKEEINEDIDYLIKEYGNEPWFLKDEEGRPVIFIYSSEHDTGEYLKKWAEIAMARNEAAKNDPTGKEKGLHVVLKSYRGYDLPILLPDLDHLQLFFPPRVEPNPYYEYLNAVDWYDYQPVNRIIVNKNSITISPAYSKKGDWRVLDYNQKAWEEAVALMAQSGMKWKLTFFNERYEHTGTKPWPVYDQLNTCPSDGVYPLNYSKLEPLHRMLPPNLKPDETLFNLSS